MTTMTIVERQFQDLAHDYSCGNLDDDYAEYKFQQLVRMYDVRGSLRERVEECRIWDIPTYSLPHHH